jgi:predicted Zn finger-like uncharacterized protein
VKYRTTCPHCASVFRLGADQLDAAQGWVQCSVCGAAFDARPSLLLEDGSPLPPPAPLAAAPLPETAPPVEHEAHEAAPGVAAAADEATPTPDALTEDFTTADTPRGIIQRDASLDLPSIILIDPDIAVPDEPGPLPQIYPAPSTYPPEPAAPAHSPAQTRPALEQACTVLGCTLSLPKNLARLQIIGSDLQTEASGRLRLTLTLGNRAGHAQAWPVLVLTLTDQRNRPLARRSFAPSEYLGDARRIADGLPPRSEQALSLPLTVRDLAPMGFDLQLTY